MEPRSKPAASGAGGHREVEISDFRLLDKKNSLKAVFTATLPSGLVIHGLMLHERGDRRWIGLPSREYTDKGGERQFSRIIEFVSRAVSDRFQAEMLEAVDRHLARSG